MSNRFQTANSHTGANGGRLSGSHTDQRRWVSASAGIGKASTRPSRSTRSRQTGAGMIFESKRTIIEAAEESTHPWKTSIKKIEGDAYEIKIAEGKIFKGLASSDQIIPVLNVATVADGDFVVLTHTEGSEGELGTVSSSVTSTFEGVNNDGDETSVIVAIISSGEDDDKLEVEQVARNNFKMVLACLDGKPSQHFLAL